ncbi:MAG: hypothetical protein HOO00_06525 [Rhodospirillaceae bacterium]|nr:hypothetical protein [Rhodospirillaceae bacterium]MBT5374900.1 hypothetical protein [Rhodospirillaceae bacterium]MBT5658628.1 hypothetical protein [Rhodospirillaceae bacterium]MBT5751873.1 hypothetical protein [Rhodospirillaceae bacterium]
MVIFFSILASVLGIAAVAVSLQTVKRLEERKEEYKEFLQGITSDLQGQIFQHNKSATDKIKVFAVDLTEIRGSENTSSNNAPIIHT